MWSSPSFLDFRGVEGSGAQHLLLERLRFRGERGHPKLVAEQSDGSTDAADTLSALITPGGKDPTRSTSTASLTCGSMAGLRPMTRLSREMVRRSFRHRAIGSRIALWTTGPLREEMEGAPTPESGEVDPRPLLAERPRHALDCAPHQSRSASPLILDGPRRGVLWGAHRRRGRCTTR